MKLDKNIILIDTIPDEGKNFCKELSESTQIKWHLIDCILSLIHIFNGTNAKQGYGYGYGHQGKK